MERITADLLSPKLLSRAPETSKRDYGHLLIVAGCDNMPGAASLATSAALRSGCGLVTLHSSVSASGVSAVTNPSAILDMDSSSCFSELPEDMSRYNAVAAGPGLGRDKQSGRAFAGLLEYIVRRGIPHVLDADALYFLSSMDTAAIAGVPNSGGPIAGYTAARGVLTPHDGELRRLCEGWKIPEGSPNLWNEAVEGRDEAARAICRITGYVVVAKGYHSKVFCPDGSEYENTTGNPGMAKGGSGDVLTGLVGGLMARGYSPEDAAVLGVWIHGYAGDCCTREFGMEAYDSSCLVDCIYKGFKKLEEL